jgi:hypothetical protein
LPPEIWKFLKSLKELLPSSSHFNDAELKHLLPIPNMTRDRAKAILEFRDEENRKSGGAKKLQWADITKRFPSLKGRKQPDWLSFD